MKRKRRGPVHHRITAISALAFIERLTDALARTESTGLESVRLARSAMQDVRDACREHVRAELGKRSRR